jgi:hypothetical protein
MNMRPPKDSVKKCAELLVTTDGQFLDSVDAYHSMYFKGLAVRCRILTQFSTPVRNKKLRIPFRIATMMLSRSVFGAECGDAD